MLKKISSYIALHAAFVSALFPSWGWTSQVSVYPVCREAQPSRIVIHNQTGGNINNLRLALNVPADISAEGWQDKVKVDGHFFLDMHPDQGLFQDGTSVLFKAVTFRSTQNELEPMKLYFMMSNELECVQGGYCSYEMFPQHAFGYIYGIAHIVKARSTSDLVERNYGWTSEVRDGVVHLTLVSDKSQTQAIPSARYVVQRNIVDAYLLYKQYYMPDRADANWGSVAFVYKSYFC